MTPYRDEFYSTSDRSQDIYFLFVDLGERDGWRAYILTNIDYKNIDSSCGTVHKLPEANPVLKDKVLAFASSKNINLRGGLYYICWTTKITSLQNMKTVAKAWSEITAYYIKHGGSFGEIQKTLKRMGKIDL